MWRRAEEMSYLWKRRLHQNLPGRGSLIPGLGIWGRQRSDVSRTEKEGSGWTAVFIAGRMASKSEQCDELFSPFTEEVRSSNRTRDRSRPLCGCTPG